MLYLLVFPPKTDPPLAGKTDAFDRSATSPYSKMTKAV